MPNLPSGYFAVADWRSGTTRPAADGAAQKFAQASTFLGPEGLHKGRQIGIGGQGGIMLDAADLGAGRRELVQMAASPGRVLTGAIAPDLCSSRIHLIRPRRRLAVSGLMVQIGSNTLGTNPVSVAGTESPAIIGSA
jgi:hypothetical protein